MSRRLAQDVGDREAVLARDRHVHARHQREVERHVAFVAVAEIVLGVLRPLVGLGQQHAVRDSGLSSSARMRFSTVVRFRQVLVVGALALHQVGHGVEPQPVDPEIEPEAQDRQHLLQHARIVEIEIGLVRIEAVPVIGAGDRVPGPVGPLGIDEDDARAGVFLVVVRPDIEVALRRAGLRPPRALEPRMLVGGVVDHQLGDHPHAARMRRGDEALGVGQRAVVGMHAAIVGDVVAVVEARRGIERQQPDRVDAEIGDVVELGDQAGEIADAVVVGIEERLDVQLVDDRVLVPERIVGQRGRARRGRATGASITALPAVRCARSRTADRRDRGGCAAACRARRSGGRASGRSPRATPSSGRPHSHSGISIAASCTLCGSRLTATRIMSRPPGVACRRAAPGR